MLIADLIQGSSAEGSQKIVNYSSLSFFTLSSCSPGVS